MSIMFTYEWDDAALVGYLNRLDQVCDLGAQQASQNIAAEAQNQVAVETGSLQDSIDFERIAPMEYSVNAGNTQGGYKGRPGRAAGTPVDYAITQEYLHQPYMTPASERGWLEYQNDLALKIGGLS